MKIITDIRELDLNARYSYADYLTWHFKERVELIMGRIFRMSPAPSSTHQQTVSVIHATLFHFLKGKHCTVFPAPFDVMLNVPGSKYDTVVQPDVTVVCDSTKITEQGCMGVPDLVVEVISKTSVRKDLHEKYNLYELALVPEYWVVQPMDRSLIIFRLNGNGKYDPSKPLTRGDKAISTILNGFELDLDELFAGGVEEPEEEYLLQ